MSENKVQTNIQVSSLIRTTKPEVIKIREIGGQGLKGDKGDKGDTGEAGVQGLNVLTGAGAPTSLLGRNGETYINAITGDVYTKTGATWNLTGNIRGPSGISDFRTEFRILTAQEILDKELTLLATPLNSSKTTVEIQNAPTQAYGVDFIVVGDKLQWSTLAFELLLEEGSRIIIRYFVS